MLWPLEAAAGSGGSRAAAANAGRPRWRGGRAGCGDWRGDGHTRCVNQVMAIDLAPRLKLEAVLPPEA
jgi:hypothetical protein